MICLKIVDDEQHENNQFVADIWYQDYVHDEISSFPLYFLSNDDANDD